MTVHRSSFQWRRLRTQSDEGSDLAIASTELEVSGPAGPLRLAVGTDGSALLLVPLAPGDEVIDIGLGRSLEMREITWRLKGVPVRFAELGCRDRRLEPVFESLVEDIIQRVAHGEVPAVAVPTAISEFRTLLAGGARPAPTLERMIGLLAELRLLTALLEQSPRAWSAWTGPLAGRHDFRAGSTAVECKATLRSSGSRITIASIDQLLPPTPGELFLNIQVFEIDVIGAWSVASEARRACTLSSDEKEIIDRLRAVDCDIEDPAWDARFSLLDETVHEVVGDFPRLTVDQLLEGRLPPGVVGVVYEIDRGSIAAPALAEVRVHDILQGLAHAS